MARERGLIGGIPDLKVTMKQIHNTDQEHVVLLRFPFHEGMTRQSVFNTYRYAVQLMFEIVPEKHHLAVMGRFSRKLVKRIHQLQEQERNQ